MELINTHSGPSIDFDGTILVLSEIKSVSRPKLVQTRSTFHTYGIVIGMKGSELSRWCYTTDIGYPKYNDESEVQRVIDELMVHYNALMNHWKL